MEVRIEREQLYREVWAEPLTKLAPKYHLSDNGLRKICKALNVPLPTAGHWAKVAAGHAIEPVPLPKDCKATFFVSRPPIDHRPFAEQSDELWLSERCAFESVEDSKIVVDLSPRRWHPAVASIRESLLDSAKKMEKAKREFERREANPRLKATPDFTGGHWPYFVRDGQILSHTHKSRPTRVSLQTYERALSILNALCLGGERRGFKVELDEQAGRIAFSGHGGRVDLRINEKLEDEWRREKTWGDRIENVRYRIPTGVLRVYLGDPWSQVAVTDRSELALEAHLNQVFVRMYALVVKEREAERERQHDARVREETALRRAGEEARRREEAVRREAERKRRETLVSEAQAWRTAALIRDYVRYLEAQGGGAEGRPGRGVEWTSWARAVADELDPSVSVRRTTEGE